MDAPSTFTALYAKRTSAKRKKWQDGTLHVRSLGSSIRLTLRDDDGRTASEVAAGRGRADLARQIEAAAAEGAEHA